MRAPFTKKPKKKYNATNDSVTRHAIGVILFLNYYVELPASFDIKTPDTLNGQIDKVMSQLYEMYNIENDPSELVEYQCVTKTLSIGKYKLPEYITDGTNRPECSSRIAFATVLTAFANHYNWKFERIDMAPQDKLFYNYDEVIFVYNKDTVIPYIKRFNEIHHIDGGNEL